MAESCSILVSLQGKPRYKGRVKIYSNTTLLKCLISYLLSNCFDSQFCKHIWTKRKLTRRAAEYMFCDEQGGVFWLVEKTTSQSGSFQLNKQFIQKLCSVVAIVSPKPVKKPVLYCTISVTVYLYSLHTTICIIWRLCY